MKTIWIKDDPLQNIISGKKIIEGRLNKGIFRSINEGEKVAFCSQKKYCEVKIININKFNNFYDMLTFYNFYDVLPFANSVMDGVSKYSTYYKTKDIEKYGVLGIQLEVI